MCGGPWPPRPVSTAPTRCSAPARRPDITPPACRSAWPAPARPRVRSRPPSRPPARAAPPLPTPARPPRQAAAARAPRLDREPWIAAAAPAGPGYLTVTVTHDALAGLAVRIVRAGPACAASDALRGRTVPAPPPADLAAARSEERRVGKECRSRWSPYHEKWSS